MRVKSQLTKIIDERFRLNGPALMVDVLADRRFVSGELIDRREVVVASTPVMQIADRQSCHFDLSRIPGDGRYSIALRGSDDQRHAFGDSITRYALLLGDRYRPVTAEFRAGEVDRHATAHVDAQRLGFFVILSRAPVETPAPQGDRKVRWLSATEPSAAAADLDLKLWAGFSRPARQALERLLRAQEPADRYGAAAALARWHAWAGDHTRALELLALKRSLSRSRLDSRESVLIEAACLTALNRGGEARRNLRQALALFGEVDADLCLAVANTLGRNDQACLDWINRPFSEVGLAPIARADASRPLVMGNLVAPAAVAASLEGPKVTVIVPVCNAADTIAYALRSIALQTWANLEVLIVDDCSTDDTLYVARRFAESDPRFRVIALDRNQGAYTARNRGLAEATGAFFTCHDADDWSHPQKIEVQMASLLSRPGTRGSTTAWARARRDLFFTGHWLPGSGLLYGNMSSFLFSREVRDRLGAWDAVRACGDLEFIRRAEQVFGAGAFVGNLSRVPLSFGLSSARSLTQSEETHDRTIHFGVRRDYLEAAAWWRQRSGVSDLRLDPGPARRPFPAPGRLLPARAPHRAYDLVVSVDFNMVGGAFQSTMNYVVAGLAAGKRIALFHWPFFRLSVNQPLNPRLWEMAEAGQVDIVSPGDEIETDVIMFGYPVMLRYPLDTPPKVRFRQLVVVVNQMAYRLHGRGDPQYDPAEVARNLRETFGTAGTWVPISGLVRRLMREIPGYPEPHHDTWVPLIDLAARSAAPLVWRGGRRARPVVGRHSRDHYTKWPAKPEALRAAYCADRPCDVQLLGGVDRALDVVGAMPGNWRAYAFDSLDVDQFLDGLDFWVHYPHEDYIEEFGRAVVEAMAAGRPVLLPAVFRETFGDAALYPAPEDVWPTIERLWRDEAACLERARAGRAFIAANCGYDRLEPRLRSLEQPAARPPLPAGLWARSESPLAPSPPG